MVVRHEMKTNWRCRGYGGTSAFYLRLKDHHVFVHDTFPYFAVASDNNETK